MKKTVMIFTCLLTLQIGISSAQQQTIKVSKICSFSPSEEADKACESEIEISYEELPPEDTLRKSITRVLTANGLKESSMSVGVLGNLLVSGMYCKPQKDLTPRLLIGKRYIGDYWIAMGILLHELGHLLNHHENLCSNPQLESDADLFAGRSLAMLKASREEAIKCLSIVIADVGHQYPPKEQRMKDILTGFNTYFNSIGVQSFTSINPLVRWKWIDSDGHYDIYVDRDTIKVPYSKYYLDFKTGTIDPVQGLLYLNATNSTYHLVNLKRGNQGMGELINDKTPLVYQRFGNNSYRLYNRGKIVTLNGVKEVDKSEDAKDYEILYRESGAKNFSKVVFVDYFFTPNEILRPAFFK